MQDNSVENPFFLVNTNGYEGPLDLLLCLIEKRKLLINDISLAEVAEDYLNYIRKFEIFPARDIAEFLPIVSSLLLIKSRSLLPSLKLSENEDQGVKKFEEQLKLYSLIRSNARVLQKQYQAQKNRLFARGKSCGDRVFSPGEKLCVSFLHRTLQNILARIPIVEKSPEEVNVSKKIALEDVIERMIGDIHIKINISLQEFDIGLTERENIVLNFLALLELVKRGSVLASQTNNFERIDISLSHISAPSYI
jgi:segregation and condensation protein A